MPFKTPVNCSGETCRNIGKHKTKYACIVDAGGSIRIRLEGVPQRWPEGCGSQGMRLTGGGGLARVPNLRVCEQPLSGGGGTCRVRRANERPAVVQSSRRGKHLQ